MARLGREALGRLFFCAALAALAAMLYTILVADDGLPKVVRLQAEIEKQARENERTRVENGFLRAQIGDVKNSPETMEAMARYQLNMIRPDEVFVQTPSEEPEPRGGSR